MRFVPGQRIDGYEVIGALGEGAYAETYTARDARSGRVVVLKCPKPQLLGDPAVLRRHRLERRVVESLDHPGVVRSLDDAAARSEPYMVLELVDGPNLRQITATAGGALPVERALDYGRRLAGTVAYLHGQGVVHRDLKPENVLVAADGTLKLIDFENAARGRGRCRSAFEDGVGTPDYMSPERVRGTCRDPRSDVYALGVILYELLTGQVPFPGNDPAAVLQAHLEGERVPIRALRPDVPAGLEAVVHTALRRYPDHRYPSAGALLADLERLGSAGDAPIDVAAYDLSPEPPMTGEAAIGTARQMWMFAGSVAAGFVALVALIITLTVVLR